MITEIVTFDLPEGMTREEAVALYEKTVPRWQANAALVRKYYLFDGEARIGGGIYLWPTKEDALAAHDAAWCDMAEAMYGSRPRFQYFEVPLIVENAGRSAAGRAGALDAALRGDSRRGAGNDGAP